MARGAKRPATRMSRAELAWMPFFASLRSGHATRDRTVIKKGRCIRTGLNICS